MRLLLDTHVLIWMTSAPEYLSRKGRNLLESIENEIAFSVVSIWEASIRYALGKPDMTLDPAVLLASLRERNCTEVALTSVQGLAVSQLPQIHRDPFDRILIAQAQVEAMTLVTADRIVARYPGPILKV